MPKRNAQIAALRCIHEPHAGSGAAMKTRPSGRRQAVQTGIEHESVMPRRLTG